MDILDAFQFTPKTCGLPDFCILNDLGELDVYVLTKFLKLNGGGTQRKYYEKFFAKKALSWKMPHLEKGKLLDFYMDQRFRRRYFNEYVKYFNERIKFSLKGNKQKSTQPLSLEFFNFLQIDAEYHLNSNEKEGIDYKEIFALFEFGDFESSETFKKIAVVQSNLWLAIANRLEDFENLSREQQQITVCGVIGVATLLGPKFFHAAVNLCPAIKSDLNYILNHPENAGPSPVEGELGTNTLSSNSNSDLSEPTTSDTGSDSLPNNLPKCLTLLKELSSALEEKNLSDNDLDTLENTIRHLRILLQSSSSTDYFHNIVIEVRTFLLSYGDSKNIPGLNDPEFISLLDQAWRNYFIEKLEIELIAGNFEKTIEEIIRRIDETAQRYADVKNQIEDSQSLLFECQGRNVSGFLENQKKTQEMAGHEEKLATLHSQRKGLESALLETILPPGITFETLGEHAEVVYDTPSLKKTILEKTQTVLVTLKKSLFPENDIDTEKVSSEKIPATVETSPLPTPEIRTVETVEEPQDPAPPSPAENPELSEIFESPASEPSPEEGTKAIEIIDTKEIHPEPLVPEPLLETVDQTEETDQELDEEPLSISKIQVELERTGRIKASGVNELALSCLDKGELNFGHYTLQAMRTLCAQEEEVIPPEIFEVAYFGSRVWSTSSNVFTHSQRLLNTLDIRKIEGWLHNRASSKLAAPMIFVACFQPTLFAGKLTIAPTFLNQVKTYFDSGTTELISDLIQFVNRNNRVTLEMLQHKEGAGETQLIPPVRVVLSDWRDKIRNSTRGWAPVRMALSKCLTDGVFSPIVTIIAEDKRSREPEVRDFVDKYCDEEIVKKLMEEVVSLYSKADIEATARDSFVRTFAEFVGLASRWLDEHAAVKGSPDVSTPFIKRLKQRLNSSVSYFEGQGQEAHDRESRSGHVFVAACMRQLLIAMEGSTIGTWPDERVALWFDFPKLLVSEELTTGEDQEIATCLLKRLSNGLDLRQMYRDSLEKQANHLALMALTALEFRGNNVAGEKVALQQTVDQTLHSLEKQRGDLELSVGTANAAGLMDDERYGILSSALEYIEEEIKGFSHFKDLRTIRDHFVRIQRELDEYFAPRITDLKFKYQTLLTKGRTSVGLDVVPDGWIQQMDEALATRDIPVVEEMLGNLEQSIRDGRKVRDEGNVGNTILTEFLSLEEPLYKFLIGNPSPRELAHIGVSEENPLGLVFPTRSSALKTAVRGLAELRNSKPPAKQNDSYLGTIGKALGFVGLKLRNGTVKYRIVDHFAYLQTQVECHPAGAPFSDFGVNQDHEANILVLHKDLDVAALERVLETDLSGKTRLFLICASPLSPQQRNAFAEFCKTNLKTIFLVDLSMLFFLGTDPESSRGTSDIRAYLLLAAPMTYYNSYVGDRMNPPDPELRYGRQAEINQVIDMSQGAAVVFGGRQLGKSTILAEARDKFNSPENKKFAFWHQGDAAFGEVIREVASADRSRRLWHKVYKDFVNTGFLQYENNLTTDEMRTRIRECLENNRDLRVMIIFDEVDPLLEADHADEFVIFRAIRELVSAPASQGRFKLVVSGLQNVKRFEDSPNYPLNQLGRSLNISIMSVSDAQKLIREPLAAFGYTFESPLVVSRIMSLTNRHPGLMQIFCQELVRTMAVNHKGSIGDQVITPADVIVAFEKEGVQSLIRQRFELTLYVDFRYAIIIFSLALEGRGTQPFSASQVREAAAYFLPELTNKTDRQIDAILDELVGLGVLKKLAGASYALRNSNIVRLLGSPADLLDKIIQAQTKQETDPLARHAFIKKLNLPSPLSFRDEKQILGVPERTEEEGKPGVKIPPKYMVSMVSGSAAQGLNLLESALENIVDFTIDEIEGKPQYEYKSFSDIGIGSLKSFNDLLRRQVSMSQKKPQMILIKVTGERSAEETLAMVEIAMQAREYHKKPFSPCKVIFSMNPKALWLWQSGLVNRDSQTPGLVHVGLGRWDDTALKSFLMRIGLPETGEPLSRLKEHTLGWYLPLFLLAGARAKDPELDTLPKLGTKVKNITDTTVKDAKEYLDKSGATALSWTLPVLKKLIEEQGGEQFTAEDLSLVILMLGYPELEDIHATIVLNWMARMNLVDSVKKDQRDKGPIGYNIDPALRTWMAKAHE